MPADEATTHPLASVRWLAQEVLAADGVRVQDVPAPRLLSAPLNRSAPMVREYALWWIDHPDPGSTFEKQIRWLRWLPRPVLLRATSVLGYDGLVFPRDDAIVGHVFFQRHGNALHAFAASVDDRFRGHGYAVTMLLDFVAYASRRPGIIAARVGRGRTSVAQRMLASLELHAARLGWTVGDDGWVRFSGRAVARS